MMKLSAVSFIPSKSKLLTGVILLATALAGCVLKPKYIAIPYIPPRNLVILPMSNESNDVRAPDFVRKEFKRQIEAKGYSVAPLEQVDELLRTKLGINEGGQLGSTTPEKIKELFPSADAFVYGDIIDFKFQNLGVYQNKAVDFDFKIVDAKNTALWEDERKASEKKVALSVKEAEDNFIKGLAEKAVGNMLNSPLLAQVNMALKQILSTLPNGQ